MPTIPDPRTKRLNVDITPEQYEGLKRHLEYGMMKNAFGVIIDDMLQMFDEYGQHFLVMLMQRKVSYKEPMEIYKRRNPEKFIERGKKDGVEMEGNYL